MQSAIWYAFIIISIGIVIRFIVWPLFARQSSLKKVYTLLDQRRAGIWAKVRVSFSGMKRKLLAASLMVAGFLLSVHDLALPFLGTIDVQSFIPAQYQQYYPIAVMLLGMLFAYLNRISPTPEGEVNPGVIAEVTNLPIEKVAEVTAPDPAVALPTQEQVAKG